MKFIYFGFLLGIIAMLSNCKKSNHKNIGYLDIISDENGYAIDDKKRSIQIIADDNDGSFSLMRNQKVLFTLSADFSRNDESFWKFAESSYDSLRLGAVVKDISVDGIPDRITMIKDPRFEGELNLATYILDGNGVPVARVLNKDGKVSLSDIIE